MVNLHTVSASGKSLLRQASYLCCTLIGAFLILFHFLFLAASPQTVLRTLLVYGAFIACAMYLEKDPEKKKRAAVQTCFLLLEISSILIYRQLYPRFGTGSLALAAMLIVNLAIRNFYTPDGWVDFKTVRSRLPQVWNHSTGAAAVACLPMFLLLLLLNCQGWLPPQLLPQVREPLPMEALMYHDPMMEHRGILKRLHTDVWGTLSLEEKREVFQAVAEVECEKMGIAYDISIITYPLHGPSGFYTQNSHRISMDETSLEKSDAEINLRVLLHELRHAYQDCLAHLYLESYGYQQLKFFDEARKHYQSFRGYPMMSGVITDIPDSYYEQYVEHDANQYSAEAIEDYRQFLR